MWQWHHLYTGSVLIGIGIYLVLSGCLWLGISLIAVGFWLVVDDAGQHILQMNDVRYHSFGNYIGKPLYHFRRWLVKKTGWEWLNKI